MAAFVTFYILLVGCADVIRTSEPTEGVTSLIQQSMELKPGMHRSEVKSMLGEPYKTSSHLRYEIYSISVIRSRFICMQLKGNKLWFPETRLKGERFQRGERESGLSFPGF